MCVGEGECSKYSRGKADGGGALETFSAFPPRKTRRNSKSWSEAAAETGKNAAEILRRHLSPLGKKHNEVATTARISIG